MKRSHNSFYLLECRCLNAEAEIAQELLLAARGFAERQRASYVTVWQYTQMIEQAIPLVTASDPYSWEATPGDGDVSGN